MAENGDVIDKVQIEIEAAAKGATAVIAQLEAQLGKLQAALNKIDTSKLKLVKAASNAINVNVNTAGMSKAERDVASSVNSIKQSLAGLGPYMDAALGGDKSMVTTFSRKAIKIQGDIDALKEKLRQLGNTATPTDAFEKLKADEEQAEAKLDELKQKIADVTSGNTPISSEGLRKLTEDATAAENELARISAEQQALVNSGQAFNDPFEQYRASIGEVEGKLEEFKGKVAEASATPNADASWLDKIKEKMSGLLADAKRLGVSFGHMMAGLAKGAKGAFGALSKAGDKLKGFFDKGLMGVLKYALGIRSLYVLFRRLRQAVKDSFVDLQSSGAFFETTRANIESLKNSLATLKFQFGAAFEPIFNAIAPALQSLINYLIAAANAISAFMARLTGKSTYSKVEAVTLAVSKNTGSAAKNAKELNKQLQNFDELNNLTTNNGGGGGGGGGGGADKDHATYTEAAVDSVLGDFGKQLADKIREGDWYGVGKTISDKLTESMASIKWDNIFEKARQFGKGLADFLNGLITPDMFGQIGRTLANGLNTAFEFLYSFADTFDWTNLGNSLASGINNFFATFDFAKAAKGVSKVIVGITHALAQFIQKTDWSQVGKKIVEFIANLDWEGIVATTMVELPTAILGAIAELLLGALEEGNNQLAKACEDIGWEAGEGFFEGMALMLEDAGKWVSEQFDKVLQAIRDFFDIHSPSKVMEDIGKLVIDGFWNGISSKLTEIKTKIEKKLEPLKKKFNEFKTNITNKWNEAAASVKEIKAELIATVGGQISKITDLDMWKTKFTNLKDAWVDKASKLASSVSGQLSRITDLDSWRSKMENLKNSWINKANTMSSKVGGQLSTIADLGTWGDKINALKTAWSDKSAFFKATTTAMSSIETWKNKITDLYNAWKGKSVDFSIKFSAAADDLKKWIDSNVFSKIRSVFRKVPILKDYVDKIAFARGGIVTEATNAIIGEAGTEAVVPLENNTGWLKKISNMMLDGLEEVSGYRYTATPPTVNYSDSAMSSAYNSSNELLIEQNRLLEEQNRLLQQIAAKDVSISSRDVYNAVYSEARNYYNRTGNNTLLF